MIIINLVIAVLGRCKKYVYSLRNNITIGEGAKIDLKTTIRVQNGGGGTPSHVRNKL
jgi:hypothetical protein